MNENENQMLEAIKEMEWDFSQLMKKYKISKEDEARLRSVMRWI